MDASGDIFGGGFADPVFGAQAVFRRLMDAMARPGTIGDLDGGDLHGGVRAPGGLSPAQAAIALCLADGDTPVFLGASVDSETLRRWLAFHAGVRVTDDPAAARFAFIAAADGVPDRLPLGEQAYPDRSATVVIEVAALGEGEGLILSGPGIAGSRSLAVSGLPAGFVAARAANHDLYPRGLDVVLTAGARLAALPRTTLVGEG